MTNDAFTVTSKPLFIAVEGNIGAGKTRLARRLAESLNATELLETANSNPFLNDFYRDPKQFALATQLHFLFSRNKINLQVKEGSLFDNRYVADFLINKELLFASVNLSDHEYQLYKQIYESMAIDSVKPDLVIYLQTSTEHSRRQLRDTHRHSQRLISDDYLDKMNDAYTRFFHFYDQSPLLIINASEIDLNDDQEYDAFFQCLLANRHGRHYYNPIPMAI